MKATLSAKNSNESRERARVLALERAAACARICEDNKGKEVLVLDMRSVTPEYDYWIIASGNSRRQLHAMAEEIDAHMKGEGETRYGIEGYESCKWIIQDYGDIVIHIFDPVSRDFYELDKLWEDAKRIDWKKY